MSIRMSIIKTRIHVKSGEGLEVIHPETSSNLVRGSINGLTVKDLLSTISNSNKLIAIQRLIVATELNQTRFEFTDEFFSKDNTVLVFMNGEFMHEGDEYTIDDSGVRPAIVFNSGYDELVKVFVLIIRKSISVADVGTVDANIFKDGVFDASKLSPALLEQLDEAATTITLPHYIGNVKGLSLEKAGNKVAIKWTDPEDLTVTSDEGAPITLATWAGTKLVYKTGSYPTNIEDGTVAVDNKVRGQYSDVGFEISGLTTGQTYYFALFPYNDNGLATNNIINRVSATLTETNLGSVTNLQIGNAGSKVHLRWTDPADVEGTFNGQPIKLAEWGGTKVVYKVGSKPANETDGTVVDVKTRDQYSASDLVLSGFAEGSVVYVKLFPYTKTGLHSSSTSNEKMITTVYPSLGNVSGFSVTSDKDVATIKWSDPSDVNGTVNGTVITTAKWSGTKLVRKAGSVPTDVNDGTLVVDSKVRNQYSSNGYTDSGLSDGVTYYYKAFPYSEDNKVTNNDANIGSVTISLFSDDSGSPGPSILLGGSESAGFFGEVPTSEFITGDALASQIGLTAGTSQFSNEPWLKFILDGKILFVAKKPFRYNLSWDQINAANAVNGTKTVSIGGNTYKVRLMRGAQNNPSADNDADRDAIGSEWNRLMLPIHVQSKDQSWAYPQYAGTVQGWNINYTDQDLHTHNSYGNGTFSWCQETTSSNASHRVFRGYIGVSSSDWHYSSYASTHSGWRPVLELIPPGEDTSGAPGATKTIAGTSEAGFFGEVSVANFITGDALASTIGLTAGTSQFSNEPWLKFILDGKILFVAKKPFRYNLSWDQINAANAVNGTKTVSIGDNTYKVRLFKGLAANNTSYTNTIGSEWNRLMLPIHIQSKDQSWDYPQYAGTVQGWNINYTDQDLHTNNGYGNGTYSWCQETPSESTSTRALRGGGGVSYSGWTNSSSANTGRGWRPVLELVPPGEDTSGAPGATKTIAGTSEAGFFGEVPASSFITGDALASLVGISAGTSQFSTTPWLKFALDGKVLFVAKKPFRHSISWDQIQSANAVNGTKTITIGGNTYKVRLMRGAQNNPSANNDADRDAIGSEWNRLMLPIHVDAPNSWKIDGTANTKYGGTTEDWNINYTDQDLHTHNSYGNGTYSWCQETASSDASGRVQRGYSGVSYSGWNASSYTNPNYGWRPVLELIPPGEDTSGAPGATKTIAGSSEAGFFGEVPSDQFITGDALASLVGISSGASQFSNEPWLKFMLDNKILFVAKKPFRHTISWNQIQAANVVDGSKTVVINGNTYKVRLMRGAENNPAIQTDADYDAIGSEWNRLMLPIHVQSKDQSWSQPAYAGTVQGWNINYTDQDLHTHNSYGNGTSSWCQEVSNRGSSYRVYRGNTGVSSSLWHGSSYANTHCGWRPVLELIPPGEDTSGAPGATKTIAGSSEAGFFGEVPSDQFITGDALALQIGLTSGTSQFSNEPWLKFMLDGKILFVAKKPFRHSISWDQINSSNAVNGSRTITIGGRNYKVRLFKGINGNNTSYANTIGSEWNRLMLPIHEQAPNQWMVNGSPNTQFGGTTEDWNINYTDSDLHTHYSYGNGTYSWCQETPSENTSRRVFRGYNGVSYSNWDISSNTITSYGWRPVLELVQAP